MLVVVGSLSIHVNDPDLAFHKARMLARAGRPVKVGPQWSTSLRPPK